MPRTCHCKRVSSEVYTPEQCWTCWRLTHVRSFQRGAGLAATGWYETTPKPGEPGRVTLRALPCIHEEQGRIAARCGSCGSVDRPERDRRYCNHPTPTVNRSGFTEPDQCTRSPVDPKILSCATCADYEAPKLRWISTAQLMRDSVRLAAKLPGNVSGIVGVPRSGMLPAAAIATQLHVPLLELAGNEVRPCATHSSRGSMLVRAPGPVVVVDDTIYSGAAMERARQALRGRPALFAAVYVHHAQAHRVNHYGAILPPPHLLEWNFPNHGPYWGSYAPELAPIYRGGVASDLDGVILHDVESGGTPGRPYLIPRAHPCKLIVTGRQERHRGATEQQLRDWGAKWERLEMLPDSEPFTAQVAARHKAHHFGASNCGLFIESCPAQAEEIHRIAGRPVICPILEKVFQ